MIPVFSGRQPTKKPRIFFLALSKLLLSIPRWSTRKLVMLGKREPMVVEGIADSGYCVDQWDRSKMTMREAGAETEIEDGL
jgi:hypothetical protein